LTNPMQKCIQDPVKLSNKGRYAIRALFDIAFFSQGGPTQVKDIAERQNIPPRFLEQIFQELKRAGMVGSKRGPQGGYSLLKPANEIRLGEVLKVTEGPVLFAPAKAKENEPVSCEAVTEAIFSELGRGVEQCFNAVTIDTICDRAEKEGLRRPTSGRYVYMI
jgi:Rrf2 family transcriptional regulator, iron-sulfur cluster assembly transcription factor